LKEYLPIYEINNLFESFRNIPYSSGTRAPPLFWVKKEEMTEERKAGRASKTKLLPPLLPLSSKSGSATEAEAFDC